MEYAKVFNQEGKVIAEGYFGSCKKYAEKFPEQRVTLGKSMNETDYFHIEGEQYFQFFDDNGNMLYDSRTHEDHEWYEFEDCHFHYEGCTFTPTGTWNNGISRNNYPCCSNCYDKREAEQEKINDRYMNITPFSGPNEYGEYYDENSY